MIAVNKLIPDASAWKIINDGATHRKLIEVVVGKMLDYLLHNGAKLQKYYQ